MDRTLNVCIQVDTMSNLYRPEVIIIIMLSLELTKTLDPFPRRLTAITYCLEIHDVYT